MTRKRQQAPGGLCIVNRFRPGNPIDDRAGIASAERVTIPFEMAKSSETTLAGSVQTFGHCPSEQTTHTLIVYAVLADGSKWYYTYDVTDQIHSAPDQRDIRILLDGLPLPEPNPAGFQPSVENWQAVDVDIEM